MNSIGFVAPYRADALRPPPIAAAAAGAGLMGTVLFAIGAGLDDRSLAVFGAVSIVFVLATLVPETLVALLLVAGGLKGSPAFATLPFDLTLAAAAAVAVAMLVRALRDGVRPLPPAVLLMVVLTAGIALSNLWSPAGSVGVEKALRFQAFSLLLFAAPFVLFRNRRALLWFASALVAAGSFVALNVAGGDVYNPLVASGGNELEAALFPALAVIAVVSYLSIAPQRRVALLWLAALPVVAPVVVQAGSRGILVACLAAVVYALVLAVRVGPRAKAVAAAVVAVAALAVAIEGQHVFGPAETKYRTSLLSGDSASILGSRSYLWSQALEIAVSHPFGLGTGGFAAVTPLAPPDSLESTASAYPHNVFLELASEQGLIFLGVFVALLGCAWRARRRALRAGIPDESRFAGALLLFGAIEALWSFDINGNRTLWLALGLCLALPRLARNDGTP